MRRTIGLAGLAVGLLLAVASAWAQTEAPVKQIALTEKQVQAYIAAWKEVGAILNKLTEDKPDPKIQAELEASAKRNGFKSFEEYDQIAGNVMLVFSGFDAQTKTFTQPPEMFKKMIADVKADKAMPAAEKTTLLADLEDSLKSARPIQHPGNIELVRKYLSKLEEMMQ